MQERIWLLTLANGSQTAFTGRDARDNCEATLQATYSALGQVMKSGGVVVDLYSINDIPFARGEWVDTLGKADHL